MAGLHDCFLGGIPEMVETPSKIILLGSGTTSILSTWPTLPTVRFNLQTIRTKTRLDCKPFCILANRSQMPKAIKYKKRKLIPEETFLIELNSRSIEDLIINEKEFHFGVSCNRDFGLWFSEKRKETKHPKFSMGFYSCLWLLNSNCEEIYIAGFDGVLNKKNGSYSYLTGNPSCRNHDMVYEWQVIQACIEKARFRGVKVYLSNC